MEGGKGGREGGRNNSWSMFSMVVSLSLSFFFSLGVGAMQAMDYSNQSEECWFHSYSDSIWVIYQI